MKAEETVLAMSFGGGVEGWPSLLGLLHDFYWREILLDTCRGKVDDTHFFI